MFDRLVEMLQYDAIFQSKGKKPQRHVKWQLACFLIRFGALGSETLRAAQVLSLGAGSVVTYCRQVTRALRERSATYICWPDAARRGEISAAIEEISGFPNVIGISDGTLFRLEAVPEENGRAFFCCKKIPAVCTLFASFVVAATYIYLQVAMQGVVDHERRFISFEGGFTGNMNDAAILKLSDLWRRRRLYFENGQYLLMDKGESCPLYSTSRSNLFTFAVQDIPLLCTPYGRSMSRKLGGCRDLNSFVVTHSTSCFRLLESRWNMYTAC